MDRPISRPPARVPRSRARTGRWYPLGATWDGRGVNFAIVSALAQSVELCLFDAQHHETRRLELHARRGIWYGYVPGCRPGDLYGFRIHGPYDPANGARCNPAKLLLDPYARSIVGPITWSPALYGYEVGGEQEDFTISGADSAAGMPKSQVIDDQFDWGDDRPPAVPWEDTVFYELHVKGFTQQHPDVREDLRGTYAGLASEAAIAHYKRLGVNAIELLPVHGFVDDQRLVEHGLRNYWGYNTIGFFAPDVRYGSHAGDGPATIAEFKGMVKLLHAAGIEVILDVVYNHTAEGNHLGPTLCFKGIDHSTYYRLSPADRRYCVDYTGTGNTLNTDNAIVVRLITDSLRYWVQQMHVDGFRFDLATTLGRAAADFTHHSKFFRAIAKDPVLSKVKLIAEPWDVGNNGYQVGGFPKPWAEWNGGYRDGIRDFWCGPVGHVNDVAPQLAGSSETYRHSGRGPNASVNIVTVHDGFTLNDLVSYNQKHNEANHEDNRDGENHNRSWNCGAEGDTDDEVVIALRERQKRNLIATLLLSQGTPLLLAGDEAGRTQGGNNNGYCQDSPISWLDWNFDERRLRMLAFTEQVLALRRDNPALRRSRFFTAEPDENGHKDITWLTPQGDEMSIEAWQQPDRHSLAALLCGFRIGEQRAGEPAPTGDSILILINRFHEPVEFTLPKLRGDAWMPLIDTRTATGLPGDAGTPRTAPYVVTGRSMVVLTQPPG
jgi:glycogen operon protein